VDFSRLTKPRFLLIYPLVAAFFFVAHISETTLRLGIPLVILGELIRWWANGYVGHRKVNWTERSRNDPKIGLLVTAGPYAFVRNPLYCGSFLIGVGFCVVVGNVWFAVTVLALLLAVYRWKIKEEEETLRHEWAEEFARYETVVPGWLPTLRPFRNGHGSWSWQGIVASQEWKTAIWVTVLLITLYFWEELIQEHERLFHRRAPLQLTLLALLAVLILSDVVYEMIRRRAKRAASTGATP